MTKSTPQKRSSRAVTGIFLSLIPVLFLQAIDMLAGNPSSWINFIIRWVFIGAVLIICWFIQRGYAKRLKLFSSMITLFAILIIGLPANVDNTAVSWIAVACIFAGLIWIDTIFAAGHVWPKKFIIHIIIACWAGFLPIGLTQIKTGFAEEEFYVLLYTLVMIILWTIIAWVNNKLKRIFEYPASQPPKTFNFSAILGALLLSSSVSFLVMVNAYQNSFYPKNAPTFAGITQQSPFLCGETIPDPEIFQAKDVYNNLIKLVKANPNKESPEFAYLALSTMDTQWVAQFKAAILNEAREALFTKPANSVKSAQYDASRRIYFYVQMINVFPDLFSPLESEMLNKWFSEINRRAQTVEWVDWLYALAFSKWPQGPYENQEIGAGLLALLETSGLADPAISEDNRNYLADNPRGWLQRFRNTDDTYVYQSVWLANALFQSQYFGSTPTDNIDQSFDWLQMQALPDGAPLGYNHPYTLPLANTAYLGAELTDKNNYLWLSGRSAEYLLAHLGYLSAYPGLIQPVGSEAHSPMEGSCLIFGDSGLPNQVGPLAPDKIVFRNGWSPDSLYLLLNLRFTGWHRYKATNTISLIYQNDPFIQDQTQGDTSGWLPVGRSLFRDKRIPRENLNGLTIEKAGLSKVVFTLTNIGSNWAQDPPLYAEINQFETSYSIDKSRTLIQDWHGWQHQRTINFNHQGQIVIMDDAKGPRNQKAAIFWHLPEIHSRVDNRLAIKTGDHPVEMVLIPLDSDLSQTSLEYQPENGEGLAVKYSSLTNGDLSLVTVFLTGNWIGADASVMQSTSGPILELRKNGQSLTFPLNITADTPG